jgi:hypothetical protein
MENELYNLSFTQFKDLFGQEASRLTKGKKARHLLRRELGLLWNKDQFMQWEHGKLILLAIQEGKEVAREVVTEYQSYPLLQKVIQQYAKKRGWHLPTPQPVITKRQLPHLP